MSVKHLYYVLIVSILANIILLWIIFKPSPHIPDNSKEIEELERLNKAIRAKNDSLKASIQASEVKIDSITSLEAKNETIYIERIRRIHEIPDSNLLDAVHNVLDSIELSDFDF